METKPEALKLQIAIRYAKAAILLSSLNSFPNLNLTPQNHHENEEMLKEEVADLKKELVRERMKNKRIKLCSLMELVIQVTVMLPLLSFFLVLAFEFC